MQLLRRAEGALQLLDVSAQLPELRRMAGLSRWVVKGAGAVYLSSWAEAEAEQVLPPCFPRPCHESMLLAACGNPWSAVHPARGQSLLLAACEGAQHDKSCPAVLPGGRLRDGCTTSGP